jgi:hypothetical protein
LGQAGQEIPEMALSPNIPGDHCQLIGRITKNGLVFWNCETENNPQPDNPKKVIDIVYGSLLACPAGLNSPIVPKWRSALKATF